MHFLWKSLLLHSKNYGSKFYPKRVIFDPTSWVNYAPTKKGPFDPGALVMNLTQIVVENDCIWGQSDYSRSHMNDSFFGQKWLVRVKTRKWPRHRVENENSRVRIRKWPQNVSQGGFKAGKLVSNLVKTYFERKAVKTRFKLVKTGLNLSKRGQNLKLWNKR